MGKILPFQTKAKDDAEAMKLLKIADEIDAVILHHIDSGTVDPQDLAGLIAHRLGSLMKNLENKERLWDICEKIIKKQAIMDRSS